MPELTEEAAVWRLFSAILIVAALVLLVAWLEHGSTAAFVVMIACLFGGIACRFDFPNP